MPGLDTIAAEAEADDAAASMPQDPQDAAATPVRLMMQGQEVEVDPANVGRAMADGAEQVPGSDGGLLGSFQAGQVAFGSTLAGGLIPGAIHNVAKRIDPAWAEGWKQNYEAARDSLGRDHPLATAVGSGLGFGADMFGPLGKLGKIAGIGKGLTGVGGVAARLGAGALGNVATMGAYNVGEQVTNNELADNEDTLAGDPSNFEKIFSAAGKDVLLNAAVGAGAHGLGELFSLARKPGGLLASLPKSPGPMSGEIADQVVGVPGAGKGVAEEAKASQSFMDSMVKAGATREQAGEAWQKLGSTAIVGPHSFMGQAIDGIADWMAERQIANNPAIKEAMAKGAAERALSATEGEAFRAAQIEKFSSAGTAALREGKAIVDELSFGMKKETVERTISGDFAKHLDVANQIGQDADAFLDLWKSRPGTGGLNVEDVGKMVERYKSGVSAVADRAIGKAVNGGSALTKESAHLFILKDNFKRELGALKKMKSANGLTAAEFVEDRNFIVRGGPEAKNMGARGLYERIQKTLEDQQIYGQAGQVQAAINQPFAEGVTNSQHAFGKLSVELDSEGWKKLPTVHTAKAATFLDAAGSAEGHTETQSLKDAIANQVDRAQQLFDHADLPPAEKAALKRAQDLFRKWGDVVTETTEASAANARIRRVVTDEGSGMSGHGLVLGTLGKLSDPLLRPVHNRMALEHLAKTADRATATAKKAVSGLLGWTSSAPKLAAPDAAKAAKEISGVRAAVSDPTKMADRTAAFVGDETHKVAPRTAAGVGAVATRALTYLASVAPKGWTPQGLLNGEADTRYSPHDLSAWHRTSEAIKNPSAVVENAKHGSLSRDGIKAIQFVYPNLYEEMRQHAQAEIAAMKTSGKLAKMPYEQKLALNTLLQLETDDTTRRPFIDAVQASKAADAPQGKGQKQAPQGGGRRPMKMDTDIFATDGQAIGGDQRR